VLGELYPAFHARSTIHVPLAMAERIDRIFEDAAVDRDHLGGPVRGLCDASGRFLGVYPTCALPPAGCAVDDPQISQDQIGRHAIVQRVFDDAVAILERTLTQVVVFVD